MSNPFRQKSNSIDERANNLKTTESKRKIIRLELTVAIVGLVGAILIFGKQVLEITFPDTVHSDHTCRSIEIGNYSSSSIEDGHIYNFNYFQQEDPRYIYKTGTFSDTLSPHLLNQFIEKIKRPSYYQFIKELVTTGDGLPMSIDIVALEELLEEEEKLQKGVFTHSDLDKIFVIAFDSLTYNCLTHEYDYKIGIAIPRYMNSYHPRLREITFKHVKQLEEQNYLQDSILGQLINLGEQVKLLVEHTDFEANFCMELREDSSYYSLFKNLNMRDQAACQLQI